MFHKQNKEYVNFFDKDINKKWLVNLTNTVVPQPVARILSLGNKFGAPIVNKKQIAVLEFIKNTKSIDYKVSEGELNEIRRSLTSCIRRSINSSSHISMINRTIDNEIRACNKFTRNNKDILVTRADEGPATVIVNKQDHVSKMEELLADKKNYKELDHDSIKEIQKDLHSLLSSLKFSKKIDEALYRRLNCADNNGTLPRAYGLPKIHKVGNPLRIIISTIGSPTYRLAKHFQLLLEKSLPKPKSHI